jgi:RHS repeat-associated protein
VLGRTTDGTNKLRYSFTRNGLGQLMTMTDHTGTTPVNYFYVLNFRGDVLGLRDKGGNMVVSYTYDAFGSILSATGTAQTADGSLLRTENPFRYASYVYDNETALYYLIDRYYHPNFGRFLTKDVVPDSNLYVYVDNNPMTYTDPDGEFPLPLIFMAARAGYMAYKAYSTYSSIKNDPIAGNVAMTLIPGGKVAKNTLKAVKSAKGIGKAINLPSYKKVSIDMGHIMSGHSKAGGRAAQSGMKDLFPSNMSQKQIENVIKNAYQHGKKVKTQGDRVKVQGKSGGITIEMWVNTKTKVIETAYPKF